MAPESKPTYTNRFEEKLAEGLTAAKLFDTVYTGSPDLRTVPDLTIFAKYLQLDMGNLQKRVRIGMGAGTGKCEVELVVKVQDTDDKVLYLVHERISPLSFKVDVVMDDLDEIADDVVGYLKSKQRKCESTAVLFPQKRVVEYPEMHMVLKDSSEARIFYVGQDSTRITYKRKLNGDLLRIKKSRIRLIYNSKDTVFKAP